MTEEEREKLCETLRLQGRANPSWGQNVSLEAAEEIERLVKLNAELMDKLAEIFVKMLEIRK